MKKLMLVFLAAAGALVFSACAAKPKLYVLNWGGYMDRTLVSAFEAEYGVAVVYREAGSNEEIDDLVERGATAYDIVVPSDYMIDKFAADGFIQPLDFDLLPHFAELTVIPKLAGLYVDENFAAYTVPYAWGTMGILYDTTNPDVSGFVTENGWAALFEAAGAYDVGMYDSPRDAVAAALLYYGFDVNTNDEEELAMAETALRDAGFTAWGRDFLKDFVIEGTLDYALVYSGDYFSEYDQAVDAGKPVGFDYFVPATTNVWMDGICIPADARNVELAHRFIDFMLRYENALRNADYIGYAPPYVEIFETMTTDASYGYDFDSFDPWPDGTNRQIFRYVSDARAALFVAIIARARGSD